MSKSRFHPLWYAAAILVAGRVGGAAHAEENPAAGVNELMRTVSAALTAETNTTAIVDFRVLKTFLPETLPHLTRTNCHGERYGPMGMTVSFAEAQYQGTNRAAITVRISDQGHRMGGLLLIAQAPWSQSEIDRETDTGYEKTTLYSGCKAHEQYNFAAKSGDIQILIAGRFLLEINGDNVTMDQMKVAAGKIDLKQLAALSPTAAATPATTVVTPPPVQPAAQTVTNLNRPPPVPAAGNKRKSAAP